MPKAKKPPPPEEGMDMAWQGTFADAMCLLMAFFVLLYAFSLQDEKTQAEFRLAFVNYFGVAEPTASDIVSTLDGGSGIALTIGQNITDSGQVEKLVRDVEGTLEETGGLVTPDNAEMVRDLLEARFAATGVADDVHVEIDHRGVVIRLPDHALFDSGSATFDDAIVPIILAEVAKVLGSVENSVDVEGHTDNVPTGASWPSNWELSGARASAVVRWLHDYGRLGEGRMRAIGYADTRPRDVNTTASGRAHNRRVEVVILVDGMVGSGLDIMGALNNDVIGLGAPLGDGLVDDTPAGDEISAGPDTAGHGADAGGQVSILDPVEVEAPRTENP